MYDVFGDIQNILKVSEITIDNNIFRLHYKATMFVLIACSLLVTQKQYFGDPIDCIVNDFDPGIMDTYCWIHSTYSVKTGKGAPHPGVGPSLIDGEPTYLRHHKYYQWVVLVLFLQALMFYVPRYLWMAWEGGKIEMLAKDLNCPIVDESIKKDRKELLVKYFTQNRNGHNFYAIRYFVCEAMNFVNVVTQIFLTDRFLGGQFLKYGTDVVRQSQKAIDDRINDPMDLVFPKVANCNFSIHGASGSIETHAGLCVLPLNVLNEKIYIFIWFWLIMVAVVSGIGLLYRVATLAIPGFRMLLLRVRSQLSSSTSVSDVANKCQIGDWFLLYLLAKNMDPLIYKEFMSDLAKKMPNNGPN